MSAYNMVFATDIDDEVVLAWDFCLVLDELVNNVALDDGLSGY